MSDAEKSPEQELGRRLEEARTDNKMTQEQVADALNIPRSAVSAIETGKRRVTSVELKRLARLYRRPISDFVTEEEIPEDPAEKRKRALLRSYGNLDEDQQHLVEQMIAQLGQVSRRRKSKPEHSGSEEAEPPTPPPTIRS